MLDFRQSLICSTLNKVLQRLHCPLEVVLTCVRWYVAYPLSLRHVEEMMHECGVFVDHSTPVELIVIRDVAAQSFNSQAYYWSGVPRELRVCCGS